MLLPVPSPSFCKSDRPSRRTSSVAFAGDPPDKDDPLLGFAPYLHRAPRRNSLTPDRQRRFIAALAATGIVTQAARRIGASLEALYALRNRPGAEGFAQAWELALDRGMARLEDCALERAIQGEERAIVSRSGEVVARWTRYDTGLITFLLRQRRAERFGMGGSFANLRPGHPIYERLRREWAREDAAKRHRDSEEVLLSINAKLERMRQRAIAKGEIPDETGRLRTETKPKAQRPRFRERWANRLAPETLPKDGDPRRTKNRRRPKARPIGRASGAKAGPVAVAQASPAQGRRRGPAGNPGKSRKDRGRPAYLSSASGSSSPRRRGNRTGHRLRALDPGSGDG